MTKPFVAILMGSDSDFPVMESAIAILNGFNVPVEVKVTSAHRTPADTHDYVLDADKRGCAVFICAAGMAAHLAGAVAALTIKPVLGVPLDASPLNGLDALLSTVQMPGGVPVGCVAIGKAGAKNAAYLACQILSLSDEGLAAKVKEDRENMAAQVTKKNKAIQARI